MRKITSPIATDFRLLGLMLLLTLSFYSFSAAQQTNDEVAQDVKTAFAHDGPGIQPVIEKYGRAATIQHLIRHITKTPQTERGRSSDIQLKKYYENISLLQIDRSDSKEDDQLFTDSSAVMLRGLKDSSFDIRQYCMEWLWKNWASSQEDYDSLTNVAISIFNGDEWLVTRSMIIDIGTWGELPSSMHNAMLEFALTNFEVNRPKFTMLKKMRTSDLPASRTLRQKAMVNLIHYGYGAILIDTAKKSDVTPIISADIALAIIDYFAHGQSTFSPAEERRILFVTDPPLLEYLRAWVLEANGDPKLNQYLTTYRDLLASLIMVVNTSFYDLDNLGEDNTLKLNTDKMLVFYKQLSEQEGPLTEYAAQITSSLEEKEREKETLPTAPVANSQ